MTTSLPMHPMAGSQHTIHSDQLAMHTYSAFETTPQQTIRMHVDTASPNPYDYIYTPHNVEQQKYDDGMEQERQQKRDGPEEPEHEKQAPDDHDRKQLSDPKAEREHVEAMVQMRMTTRIGKQHSAHVGRWEETGEGSCAEG